MFELCMNECWGSCKNRTKVTTEIKLGLKCDRKAVSFS